MNSPKPKKTILVTGGSGLIGQAIKKLCDNKHYWIFLSSSDCDLRNPDATQKLFNATKPHYVIHLAANVGGLYKNMNNPVQMFEDNMLMNINVIQCAYKSKVRNLVCCLSTCIFPDNTTYPINEQMLHNGPPHESNYAYAYAKRMLEIQCKAYNTQYGVNYKCIIPTNVYGPYDNFSLEDGHVIPSLIHKCYLAKRENKDFVIRGTGKPLRQFIYSDDLAMLIISFLFNKTAKDAIILSVDEKDEVSIKDAATYIARTFEYEHKMVFDDSYSDGQYKKTADNTKLRDLQGDFIFTDLKDGIERTISWFKENYHVCRK